MHLRWISNYNITIAYLYIRKTDSLAVKLMTFMKVRGQSNVVGRLFWYAIHQWCPLILWFRLKGNIFCIFCFGHENNGMLLFIYSSSVVYCLLSSLCVRTHFYSATYLRLATGKYPSNKARLVYQTQHIHLLFLC